MRSILPALALAGALPIATGCGGPSIDVGVPFSVAFVSPSHGASGVAVDVEPSVGFNEAVDPASLDEGLVVRSGDKELDRTLLMSPGGRVVTVLLGRELPADVAVEIEVGADVRSNEGVRLGAALAVSFTTAAE